MKQTVVIDNGEISRRKSTLNMDKFHIFCLGVAKKCIHPRFYLEWLSLVLPLDSYCCPRCIEILFLWRRFLFHGIENGGLAAGQVKYVGGFSLPGRDLGVTSKFWLSVPFARSWVCVVQSSPRSSSDRSLGRTCQIISQISCRWSIINFRVILLTLGESARPFGTVSGFRETVSGFQ
jgi:hypothetical protein